MKPLAIKGPALAALAALLACGTQAKACQAPEPGLEAGALRSRWEEFAAQGRLLVREQGTLRRTALALTLPCGPLTWSLHGAWSQGGRDYDGVSNTGIAVTSHSTIDDSELVLQGMQALDDRWSWGLRLGQRRLRREIAGSGAVLGYTERFSYGQAALGLRYQRLLRPDTALAATVWVGGGPGGRLAVQLPRTDPAVLTLGRSRLLQLALQVGRAEPAEPRPGWSWQLGLYYRRERMEAGPAQALTRNGIPIGAALQPRTVQTARGLELSLRYRF